ncbi:MAG: DUF2339 domain-containing protein [Defluviitaleaceae bacterium]|nr:DUF2339 domain-containing protein [Defluviitaleaceae bacterium]
MSFRDILNQQQNMLNELEAQVLAYESADLYVENKTLKAQVDELSDSYKALSSSFDDIKRQNNKLIEVVHDSANRERRQYIDNAKERMVIYFSKATAWEENKLTALEIDIKSRTDLMINQMRRQGVEISHPLYQKMKEFKQESEIAIQEAKANIAAQQALTDTDKDAFDALQSEPLSREQMIALAKKYSIERFVGLNLISTVGIILIIIAAIFVGQFTVARVSDAQRAIAIFVFGGAMLCAGEYFNRRKASALSLSVSAGGIAILYVALAFSYFALDVFGIIPALVICVATTTIAFVLSTRYKSQVILILAYAGGHMPFFAIVLDVSLVYGLMVYFIILNLLVLFVSFKMKWTVSSFIGLGFNILAVWGILFLGTEPGAGISPFILIGYIFIAFLTYTAIPIIGTYITKGRFAAEDNVLIGINTIISCATMYTAFGIFGWGDYMGLLAVIFAVIYFGLSIILWKKFKNAEETRDIAALTGLVFFVLIMPLHFAVVWLSLGWLVQGVALGLYGILKENKRVKYVGFIIFGLCVLVFLGFDITSYIAGVEGFHFGLRYLSVTAGSILLLAAFYIKKTTFGDGHRIYKTLVLTNVWIYFVYLASHLNNRLDWAYPLSSFYLMVAVQAVLAWGLAYSISRMKILFDGSTLVLIYIMYIVSLVVFFALNMFGGFVPYYIGAGSYGVTLGATAVIVAVSGLSVFSLYDVLKHFVKYAGLKSVYVHVIISIYVLVVITQNAIVHYGIGFTNIWLSVFYVLAALGWIIYGFTRGHMQMRRNGLVLALGAVAKVFLLDLAGLPLEQRIISFFVMGGLLVGIGYLYQYFSKKLEFKLELPEEKPEE